jgi:hypothetical protein
LACGRGWVRAPEEAGNRRCHSDGCSYSDTKLSDGCRPGANRAG